MKSLSRQKKVLYAAAVTLFLLLGAETILRLFDFSFYYNFGADLLGMPLLDLHRLRRTQNRTVDFDPDLFWKFRPNQRLTAAGVYRRPVTINSHGFRGRDWSEAKASGVCRIACLGDSSTFGWSVGDDETYPAQLERILARQCGEKKIEVLNLGVTGYTSFQGRQLMFLSVHRWQPDVIFFAFGPNDRLPALKSDAQHQAERTWAISPLARFLHEFQVYKLLKAGVVYFRQRAEGLSLDPKTYIPRLQRKVSMEEFAENVREVKRAADKAGAALVLVNVDYPSLPEDAADVELRRLAAEHGSVMPGDWRFWDAAELHARLSAELKVPVVDIRSLFRRALEEIEAGRLMPERAEEKRRALGEQLERESWRYLMIDNGHPNEWGHEIIAHALAEQIVALPDLAECCPGEKP